LLAFVIRTAGEKHQAAGLTPEGGIKMTESLKEDRRRRKINMSQKIGKCTTKSGKSLE
jgi:hypothetical protein